MMKRELFRTDKLNGKLANRKYAHGYGLLLYILLAISFIGQSCILETRSNNSVEEENVTINVQQLSKRKISQSVIKPQMIKVEGGSFMMGCTAEQGKDCFGWEKPVHKITLDSYFMGKTEVTNEQYVRFLNNVDDVEDIWLNIESNYCKIEKREELFHVKKEFGNYPAVEVSWYGAVAYCNWLSEKENRERVYIINGKSVESNLEIKGYRLPTEAEWEYAARSRGKFEKYAGTNKETELSTYAKYYDAKDENISIIPVASLKPNDLGLFDMSGNAAEWCEDLYTEDFYENSSEKNPCNINIKGKERRAMRGGSWYITPNFCRVSCRNGYPPLNRYSVIGFRLTMPDSE